MTVAMVPYLVEHHVKDKEAWINHFNGTVEASKGKSSDEIRAMAMFQQKSQPTMTCSSVDMDIIICTWMVPETMTFEDAEAMIAEFVGPSSSVENKLYKINSSCGVDGIFTADRYLDDFKIMTEDGITKGYSSDVDLYFAHHEITDQDAWKKWALDGFEKVTKVKEYKDVKTCFGMPMAFDNVVYMDLGDDAAACLWTCPKDTPVEEFQAEMDKFTMGNSKNTVYKINQELCLSIGHLSTAAFVEHAIAIAKMLFKQGVIGSCDEEKVPAAEESSSSSLLDGDEDTEA